MDRLQTAQDLHKEFEALELRVAQLEEDHRAWRKLMRVASDFFRQLGRGAFAPEDAATRLRTITEGRVTPIASRADDAEIAAQLEPQRHTFTTRQRERIERAAEQGFAQSEQRAAALEAARARAKDAFAASRAPLAAEQLPANIGSTRTPTKLTGRQKSRIARSAQQNVQRGEYTRAIAQYQRLVQDDPHDARAHLKLGNLQVRSGDTANAIATYRKVANFYEEQGFYLKAVATLLQILKHDPSIVDIHRQLADLYTQLGLLQDAFVHYRAAIAATEAQGLREERFPLLERLIKLEPNNVDTRLMLADAYGANLKLAAEDAQLAVAMHICKEQERMDEWVRIAERRIAADLKRSDLRIALARYCLEHEMAGEAVTHLEVLHSSAHIEQQREILTLLERAYVALEDLDRAAVVKREREELDANAEAAQE